MTPRIGIIGGGQLGKMLIEAAHVWNVPCTYLEAEENTPAGLVCKNHIKGSLQNAKDLYTLSQHCDVLTYEIEHINAEALWEIEQQGKTVIPSAQVLMMIQDKGKQKLFLTQNNIPTSPFVIVENNDLLLSFCKQDQQKKIVLKTLKGGYDGKGVKVVNKENIQNDFDTFDGKPYLAEQYIPFECEIAVIVAQDTFGNRTQFPPVSMEFDHEGNLVKYVHCPAQVAEITIQKASALAMQTMKAINQAGIFAVEMFVTAKGECFVNEIAPRPHNSGHLTIECCYTSQYQQLLRILLGLPLGSTNIIQPAIMLNLIGKKNQTGNYTWKGLDKVYKTEGAYLHLYGKSTTKPFRKLGHITLLSNNKENLKTIANELEKEIDTEAQ